MFRRFKCYILGHNYHFIGHKEPVGTTDIEMHQICIRCYHPEIDTYRMDHPFVDKEYEWWMKTPLKETQC
jgi:hypothetical protein